MAKAKKVQKVDTTNIASVDVKVSVDWYKSRTWGYCPKAKVYLTFYDVDGTSTNWEVLEAKATGCGYDKLSSVIASCFNASSLLRSFIYDKYPMFQDSEYREFSVYGAYSYGGSLPVFIGGAGIGELERFAAKYGVLHYNHPTKHADAIRFTLQATK